MSLRRNIFFFSVLFFFVWWEMNVMNLLSYFICLSTVCWMTQIIWPLNLNLIYNFYEEKVLSRSLRIVQSHTPIALCYRLIFQLICKGTFPLAIMNFSFLKFGNYLKPWMNNDLCLPPFTSFYIHQVNNDLWITWNVVLLGLDWNQIAVHRW